MRIKMIVLFLFGTVLASASIFFLYYTVRLLYLNLTSADAAAHRSGGMLIGAIAFPVAVIVFGTLSWLCFKKVRGLKQK